MSRSVALALGALSVVLVLLPLTVPKPGMPATLKADEPAYLLSSLSLVHDFDLRCELQDLERLFDSYPYLTTRNLIVGTGDGWHTLFYGKPYLYPLLAAPFTALFGPDGMVAFNMLLLIAMIWMGTDALRAYNPDWLAALFSAGFFLISTVWSYVFWLHPEVFMAASVTACLYFGLHVANLPERPRRRWRRLWSPRWAPVLSAAALACGAYHKPMLLAFGAPVALFLVTKRRYRSLAVWCAGGLVTALLVAGGSWLLIGHPTPYLGVDRAGFPVETPDQPPVEPADVLPAAEREVLDERSAGWWWIFRMPELSWPDLVEDSRYFFIGRHTGWLLYMPFGALALLLFLGHGRRSAVRWSVLAAIAGVGFFLLAWIPFNWHGGGGFVGNRYFVIAYPGFLFLVTRIRPEWSVVPMWGFGGLMLGPMLLAPYGAVVSQPTLQAHARARPFQAFPYELALKEIPGHHGAVIEDVWFLGRKDQIRPIDDAIWIQGADQVELWLQSAKPLERLVFDVTSPAPDNLVTLRTDGDRAALRAGPAAQRVVLRPVRATRVRDDLDLRTGVMHRVWAYRLDVTTRTGELPRWRDSVPPHHFYLGAALAYRGDDPDAAAPAIVPPAIE